ncbi:hypothetical protein [Rufibacter hautae]|uniref:Uncharacterized protein n=1 Tax=Rufibacter hautae TaxID=2595005 RepID=A0A5B6TQF1_9BACT|nr:hypothetical protein [Rufibacter hautae]KAA3438653.1 hypothetical protein FOA19_15635 [Rufibacter hautae]
MLSQKQPWLQSAKVDFWFILSPPFLCLLAIMLFPGFFQQHVKSLPVPAWVLLVLLIDVGHVYSTLFRTYFEKETLQQRRQLLLWVPFIAYAGGILLYSLGEGVFWRVLAYLAVYHFVRQQYGFMRLYSRQEERPKWEYLFDSICVYAATLLPLLYWHLEGSRHFNWFVEDDFVRLAYPAAAPWVAFLNIGLFLVYLLKEAWVYWQTRRFNLPRNLVIMGTFLAWYIGIVQYNGDLIFTTFNVVSHGIPYLALVWISRKKQKNSTSSHRQTNWKYQLVMGLTGVGFFIGLVVVLAYLEEGLWDALVWREHPQVFSSFQMLPQIEDQLLLSILVPLLALPQMTHYLLDGFIWKTSKPKQPKA